MYNINRSTINIFSTREKKTTVKTTVVFKIYFLFKDCLKIELFYNFNKPASALYL